MKKAPLSKIPTRCLSSATQLHLHLTQKFIKTFHSSSKQISRKYMQTASTPSEITTHNEYMRDESATTCSFVYIPLTHREISAQKFRRKKLPKEPSTAFNPSSSSLCRLSVGGFPLLCVCFPIMITSAENRQR